MPTVPSTSKCELTNLFDFSLLNARSVRNKTMIIKDFVVDKNTDILALTETWLPPSGNDLIIGDLCPTGYSFLHTPRHGSIGGGVGLLFKESLNIKRNAQEVFRSFEYLDSSFLNFLHIRIIVVYRPPPSSANSLTSTLFFEEFSSFLEGIIVSPGQLLIAGDFNFHLDNPNDPLTKQFVDLLASFDLKQYISGSTHASGHTLDLIITRSEENIVNHYNIFDPLISDHSVVHLQLLIRKPKFVKKNLLLRNLRAVNIHKFKTDVLNSFLLKNFTTMDLVSLVNEYDCLHTILDNHAPIKSREITLRPKAPWYTNEIDDKKRIRRQLERKWHKTRMNADWNRYKQQCYAVNKLIDSSKSAYYTDLINNGSSEQKTLFRTVSNLLHTNTIIRYPSSPDPMSLANSFSDFFTQKIVKIRGDIEDELLIKNIENPIPDADSCPYEFHTFREVGKDEVLHLIQRVATKSCSLDPLPVVMLNHCFKDILPVVARIINLSLESGTMPDSLKIAVVQPLLKKYNLSYEKFCSFRPISNLKFVSKSIEKAVAVQLTDYLTENHLHEKFQSAYKPCHSTETALLRVQNDILQALDNGDSVILVLLDLSAAFDTVDHLMLLTRLSKRFGIRGRVLDWLTSYLTSRKQFIRVEGTDSLLSDLDCGVPQGSVLGPLLYSLYTAPLADVARRHNLRFHFFSDDGQLYIAFKTNDRDDLISSKIRMEKCILELGNWLMLNKLKLNSGKTELILVHSRYHLMPPLNYIMVGKEKIVPTVSARNLGVIFDEWIKLGEHINGICKSAYYHIRNISRIKKYLPRNCLEIIIHAFITSRLDYCNSLLYGVPKYLLQKLQRVQNTAARLLTDTKKSAHITPVLIELHWLPVQYRIQFKIILLVYKAVNDLAPSYLKELMLCRTSQRTLRSNGNELLQIPYSRLKTYGDRSFCVAGPRLWNDLPVHLRMCESLTIFKKYLKTYLFNLFLNSV